jgi:hypothetical protein
VPRKSLVRDRLLLTPDYLILDANLRPQAHAQAKKTLIRSKLRGSPAGITRKAQEFSGGTVQGGGETSGASSNDGQVVSSDAAGSVSTVAIDGAFNIKSGGAGFVKTNEGGAEGSGASGVSGTSSGGIAESQNNMLGGGASPVLGEVTFKGSSAANSKGSFVAGYSPDQSVNPTGGTGSGSGSAGVVQSSAFPMGYNPGVNIGVVLASATVSQSGAAESFGGGRSTGFTNLASAGGVGSGSAAVKSNGFNDAYVGADPAATGATSNQAATATFDGDASGTYGKVTNQPYIGGTAIGSGNGSGTSTVGGSLSSFNARGGVAGDADFKSTGGSSSFVDGTLGKANGSSSGGASGEANGKTYGFVGGGDLAFGGSSAAGGNGAFVAGFSPSFQDGTTGGSGSGSGSLDAAGSGNAKPINGSPRVFGMAYGGGTAESNGGGSGSATNIFGEAGGLGSGATKGGASGAGEGRSTDAQLMQGATTTTGTFDTAGGGSFGSPTSVLIIP